VSEDELHDNKNSNFPQNYQENNKCTSIFYNNLSDRESSHKSFLFTIQITSISGILVSQTAYSYNGTYMNYVLFHNHRDENYAKNTKSQIVENSFLILLPKSRVCKTRTRA
jgi:hypothetical protein